MKYIVFIMILLTSYAYGQNQAQSGLSIIVLPDSETLYK